MNTSMRPALVLALLLGACSHARTLTRAQPAPPDSALVRSWQTVDIRGSLGTIQMPVPAIEVATNFVIDSVALREMEKRLTARVASIAREQAASLSVSGTSGFSHHAAPEIKRDLLGSIEFPGDSIALNVAALTRLQAMARLAQDVAGGIEIVAEQAGTGPALFDVAIARARRVYLTLLSANPRLADRPVDLNVRTRNVLPGAPRAAPAVEVYIRPE